MVWLQMLWKFVCVWHSSHVKWTLIHESCQFNSCWSFLCSYNHSRVRRVTPLSKAEHVRTTHEIFFKVPFHKWQLSLWNWHNGQVSLNLWQVLDSIESSSETIGRGPWQCVKFIFIQIRQVPFTHSDYESRLLGKCQSNWASGLRPHRSSGGKCISVAMSLHLSSRELLKRLNASCWM